MLSYSGSWSEVSMGPDDPILGLTQAYQKDSHPKKVSLGVGAYRDDNGKPFVLDCVREAEKRLSGRANHEYAPITGVPEFRKAAAELAFGEDSPVLREGRNVTAQSISGTGALRVGAEWLARWLPGTPIYLPTPTWANHKAIFEDSGIAVRSYRYYDADTCGLQLDAMLEDIRAAPQGSIFCYHACAHNPTGVDPTPEQWKLISQATMEMGHYTLFDLAYQGFASGDAERDAFALRTFCQDGHNVALCQSFAKNFGLYGQRAGAFTIVAGSAEEAQRIDSQLKILIRPLYSNPPIHGARIVATILQDKDLRSQWEKEVRVMADRINAMRSTLVEKLQEAGSTRNWDHIVKQIGMFTFTGMTPEQVDRMREEYHIYLTRNGRISVAGLNSSNVGYVANAIHAVTQ